MMAFVRRIAKCAVLLLFFLPLLSVAADQGAVRKDLVMLPITIAKPAAVSADDLSVNIGGKPVKLESLAPMTQGAAIPRAPQGVLSNRMPTGPLTIVVLDHDSARRQELPGIRNEMIELLRDAAKSGDPMLMIVLTGKMMLVVHAPGDPEVLRLALAKMDNALQPAKAVPVDVPAALSADVEAETQRLLALAKMEDLSHQPEFFERIRTRVEALANIGQAYAGTPGRKTLIWIATEMPFFVDEDKAQLIPPIVHNPGSMTVNRITDKSNVADADELLPQSDLNKLQPVFSRAVQALQQANIAVYPFRVQVSPGYAMLVRGSWQISDQQLLDTLHRMAGITGGKVWLGGGNLRPWIETARQAGTGYVAAFAPDKKDVGWRKVSFKLRGEDAAVQAPQGFLRLTDKALDADRKLALNLAGSSPLSCAGVPMFVRLSPPQGGAKKKFQFALALPASAIQLDRNALDLEISYLVWKPGMKPTGNTEPVKANLDADGLSKFQKYGFNYNNEFELEPGEYDVRFLVRDNVSGRMGTVITSLKVN